MMYLAENLRKYRMMKNMTQEYVAERLGVSAQSVSRWETAEGDTYNLMGKYILRNAIGILPEFEDVSKYEIYVNEKAGRCYCKI